MSAVKLSDASTEERPERDHAAGSSQRPWLAWIVGGFTALWASIAAQLRDLLARNYLQKALPPPVETLETDAAPTAAATADTLTADVNAADTSTADTATTDASTTDAPAAAPTTDAPTADGLTTDASTADAATADTTTTTTVTNTPTTYTTAEKHLRINDNGRMIKRSLRPDEFAIKTDGQPFIPLHVVNNLKNEAACLRYIRAHTDIPVPDVLAEFEAEDGTYNLEMQFVDGVEMYELPADQLPKVMSQMDYEPTATWQQQHSDDLDFVFCHGDLHQCNILVDPKTAKIVAVIDWEYSGFYPERHELPFYESKLPAGAQLSSAKLKPLVDEIENFWAKCAS